MEMQSSRMQEPDMGCMGSIELRVRAIAHALSQRVGLVIS